MSISTRLPTFIIFSSIIFLRFGAHPQTGTIKEQIQTSDRQPAAYVNVVIKETGKGTISDEAGTYLLKLIKAGAYTVITSFVGFQTQEKQVTVESGQTVDLHFSQIESAQQLSEVVITDRRNLNEKIRSIGKSAIKPIDLPQSRAIIGKDILEQQQSLRLSDVLKNTNGL
jgi:iron complex outermembrane recepter protein